MVVTQRATQLYAQSLRGGSNYKAGEEKKQVPLGGKEAKNNSVFMPWWVVGVAGGVGIAIAAFMAGMLWSNRRTSGTGAITPSRNAYASVKDFHAGTPSKDQSSESVDNHHLNSQSQATSQK